jgi:hypothetical protein
VVDVVVMEQWQIQDLPPSQWMDTLRLGHLADQWLCVHILPRSPFELVLDIAMDPSIPSWWIDHHAGVQIQWVAACKDTFLALISLGSRIIKVLCVFSRGTATLVQKLELS